MKIFDSKQIRAWDAFTIQNEPVRSLDLIGRASIAFAAWFVETFPDSSNPIYIFCGPGNNGGDGLAIARLLQIEFYDVHVVLPASANRAADNEALLDAARQVEGLDIHSVTNLAELPAIEEKAIVIDALFGTGLSRPIGGFMETLVTHMNDLEVIRVAVDVPSGLLSDSISEGTIFQADYTCSFEQPKLAFMFPENQQFVGNWSAVPIKLSPVFYENEGAENHLLTREMVWELFKPRTKFEHKGSFGHALIVAGSKGKMGAAVLASLACLRSGSGLTTTYVPACGYEILQTNVPEAMVLTDPSDLFISESPELKTYNAIGIGCGIGTAAETVSTLGVFLDGVTQPIVLDADALNIIAANREYLNKIPKGSILTPHPKEFERLFGETANSFEQNELQRLNAAKLGSYILLKGAHSCIATPNGQCFFNSTGNPGMATAGSGDVLTGILTGLLAQGYTAEAALLLGVYLHGLAGDLAATELSKKAMIARDIIAFLPKALIELSDNI